MPAQARVLFLKSRGKTYDPIVACITEAVVLECADSLAAFKKLIASNDYEAILCTSTFRGGTYRDLLTWTQRQRLDIPVIVCAKTGGDREWVEALERGAFDLLVSPFQKNTVVRVVEEALESRDAGREVSREVSWETRPLAPRRRRSA